MASDAYTLDRLRNLMHARKRTWHEKKMFGGDCFMVDDKMCFGTYKGGIMFRVHPDEGEGLIQRPGMELMVQGGKAMPGYVQAAPEAYDRDDDLAMLVDLALAFNPLAKASKKK